MRLAICTTMPNAPDELAKAAEERGCYCFPSKNRHATKVAFGVYLTLFKWQILRLIGRGPLAGTRKPPTGFCGWCEVCGKPGHTRHAPGAPYTSAWCDSCWEKLTAEPVDLSHQRFPDLRGCEVKSLLAEELWIDAEKEPGINILWLRAGTAISIGLFFKDSEVFCIDRPGPDPEPSPPDPSARLEFTYINLLDQLGDAPATILEATFSSAVVIKFSDGSTVRFEQVNETGELTVVRE